MGIWAWLEKRRNKKREALAKKEYQRGYLWAESMVLQRGRSPLAVESFYGSYGKDRYSDFERGANAALNILVAKGVVKDNRF